MSLNAIAIGLLTVSISSASILVLVYLRVLKEIEELKDKGDWADKDRDNPEYLLASFLKWSIYLGSLAGILTLVSLFFNLHVRPTLQLKLDITLVVFSGILIALEISAVVAGIKYLGG